MSTTSKHPASSKPVYANYASEKIVQGAGVAIFHIASERVVSGYRNRLLPLPILHRQPDEDEENPRAFVTEPLWHQFMPQSSTAQYILSWYAAETLPAEIETQLNAQTNTNPDTQDPDPEAVVQRRYAPAPAYPETLTLHERVKLDINTSYTPPRHLGTGVDDEEACYEAHLLPIAEARKKLRGSIMEDVVRRSWEAILLRQKMESNNN
ncbi:hypothetical protein MBLNU457_3488t2 [Dothideomycetes sp. NU457]